MNQTELNQHVVPIKVSEGLTKCLPTLAALGRLGLPDHHKMLPARRGDEPFRSASKPLGQHFASYEYEGNQARLRVLI
jgi:hypothetical protein